MLFFLVKLTIASTSTSWPLVIKREAINGAHFLRRKIKDLVCIYSAGLNSLEKQLYMKIYYKVCDYKYTKKHKYIAEIKENFNFFHKVIIFKSTNIYLYFYSILLCTIKHHFMIIESIKNSISFQFMVNVVVYQIILGNRPFCTKIFKKNWLLNN